MHVKDLNDSGRGRKVSNSYKGFDEIVANRSTEEDLMNLDVLFGFLVGCGVLYGIGHLMDWIEGIVDKICGDK